MSERALRIGTRGSAMAIAQTDAIIDALTNAHPGLGVEKAVRETSGDRDTVGRLGQHGGKGGAFVEELRNLLKAGEVDMLMHSLKDIPGNREYYETESEFRIGAFLPREDPRDVLVLAPNRDLVAVLNEGTIGTNAVRRRAYLRHQYRQIRVVHFRGKVDSRIAKLDSSGTQDLPYGAKAGPIDGLVLAKSGLERIGFGNRISKVFSIDEMCPAVGQGVVVVEYQADNVRVKELLAKISDKNTEKTCLAERAMLRELNGHCNSPIAGHAWLENGRLFLRGAVVSLDGRHLIEYEDSTEVAGPEELGTRVAEQVKVRGAEYIIDQSRNAE